MKNGKLYDIHCPTCGAPAYFDIKKQIYNCSYCGGTVGIDQAKSDHKGFREIQKRKLNKDVRNFELQKAECTGCGAKLVFDKGDAVANCAFCGRSLVRKAFVNADNIPELIIPFSITESEARVVLKDWCDKNKKKPEARKISMKLDDLNGCYLSYELVKGPVKCDVSRIDGGSIYECGGFVDEVLINCSAKLDNRLLDGMEPYEPDGLKEFDFSYVAGHQVKIGDISNDELIRRIDNEVGEDYKPVIQRTLETKAVSVNAHAYDVVRMPVLLPVYYLAFDECLAAVNGQTGRVSVRAEKDSKYIILPWWLKAILSAAIGTVSIALIMLLLGAETDLIYVASGCLLLILLIIFFAAYSQQKEDRCGLVTYRKIYASKGGRYIREGDRLVQTKEEHKKPVIPPVFFMDIEGKREPVMLKFTAPLRVARALMLTFGIVFLPVIFALLINGFDFSQINLGGSAVWFCLAVPLAPVFLIKYGRMDIYDNPWIYLIGENDGKKRYRPKKDSEEKRYFKLFIIDIIKPPLLWVTLIMMLLFCTMVYLTAFGFE
ncbi:MAG: hypothetical protein K5871_00910 [Lachnospiraceae bacterium]|nr:hypothetical protein [Lachnospiraceae bacterium]